MGDRDGPFPWLGMLMWLGLYIGPWLLVALGVWAVIHAWD